MKKWIVFGLIFLISSVLFQALPVEAQSNSVISLVEQNIILPNSDVELISGGGDTIYAAVKWRSKYYLFLSENKGRTWQKVSGQGLPEKEKFISLELLANQPEIVALATTTMVYLSYDEGERFGCLGGPQDLTERKEEITSLAISGESIPQILVGVWHPSQGKFAQEGVYLWQGKGGWEAQGMRRTWQGKGYNADVTAVAFLESTIVAVATGDPDGSGPLPEGTYLNMGYPNQRSTFGAEWNWPSLSGWPVEVAETQGLSPTEREILNSRIVFSEDLEIEDPEERNFYVLSNTRDKDKDGVYKVEDIEVRQLEIPKYPEIVSLDSLDYVGTYFEGTLAVGVTCKDRDKRDQAQVYYLPSDEERFTPLDWSTKWMKVPETRNCQVAFSPDFADSGIIFAATSGKNSSFARSERNILVPISLMDISGGIAQLSPSPRFLVDRTLFLTYGDRNILKIVLEEDYQLGWVERILLVPERFNPAEIKIEPCSNYLVFIFETGTTRFWLTKNGGLSWSERKIKTEIMDAKVGVDDGVVYIAGKDSMIYRSDTGTSWQQRISSGIRWLQKIELGPEGKILAVGGSEEEDISNTISLVGEKSYEVLPTLPALGKYVEVAYSPKDESIYSRGHKQLYALVVGQNYWQKIIEGRRLIKKLLISPQGLYLFYEPQVYFSSFPLSEDSQWEAVEEVEGNWLGCRLTELDERSNLLFFWDSSQIVTYQHQIQEGEIFPQPEPKPDSPEAKIAAAEKALDEAVADKIAAEKAAAKAITELAEVEAELAGLEQGLAQAVTDKDTAEKAAKQATDQLTAATARITELEGFLDEAVADKIAAEPGKGWIVPTVIAVIVFIAIIILIRLIRRRRI